MHGINMTNQKPNQWHVHLHTINFRHLLLFFIDHFLCSLASAPPSHLRLAKEECVGSCGETVHSPSLNHALTHGDSRTHFIPSPRPLTQPCTHFLTYDARVCLLAYLDSSGLLVLVSPRVTRTATSLRRLHKPSPPHAVSFRVAMRSGACVRACLYLRSGFGVFDMFGLLASYASSPCALDSDRSVLTHPRFLHGCEW